MQVTEAGDTRVLLMKHIEQTPGIRYRELLRLTGLVNGVLSYHLSALERANVIKVNRESRITRYYPVNVSDRESAILKFVRHEPIRQILLFILEHDMCTFNEIADHTGKAPSTVSSHIKRLRGAGIVLVRHGENHQLYRVAERDLITEVLSKYAATFTDKVVDNYTEMLEEL
ncbi:MAG: winged helix-turn-helix transcriptional regulator [Thermoproteota archaeon]|nr:winged helix-turn-helix transcriptional regulator [Thermoproteota archaeon]